MAVTAGATFIVIVAVFPFAVFAVMTASPAAAAFTRPLVALTVATAVLFEDQVTAVSTVALDGVMTASSWHVPPTGKDWPYGLPDLTTMATLVGDGVGIGVALATAL